MKKLPKSVEIHQIIKESFSNSDTLLEASGSSTMPPFEYGLLLIPPGDMLRYFSEASKTTEEFWEKYEYIHLMEPYVYCTMLPRLMNVSLDDECHDYVNVRSILDLLNFTSFIRTSHKGVKKKEDLSLRASDDSNIKAYLDTRNKLTKNILLNLRVYSTGQRKVIVSWVEYQLSVAVVGWDEEYFNYTLSALKSIDS